MARLRLKTKNFLVLTNELAASQRSDPELLTLRTYIEIGQVPPKNKIVPRCLRSKIFAELFDLIEVMDDLQEVHLKDDLTRALTIVPDYIV